MTRIPAVTFILGMLWGELAIAAPFLDDVATPQQVLADSATLAQHSQGNATPKPQHLLNNQEEQSMTLEEAQSIALQNYPQIIAAELKMKSAKQGVKVARSYYLPQVTGNAVRAFADQNTRIAAPGGINNPSVIDRGSAGVGVSQLITDFGHTNDLIESSKLELEAQKERANLTHETVLLDVTRAYFNVLRAQSVLRVAKATLKTRKTLLDQISSLRDAKMKSNLDLSIAKQVVNEANLLLLTAKNGVDDAQATLSEALGYSGPKHFVLTDDAKITPPPPDLDALTQQAYDHNPELAALKAERDAARKRAEAEAEAQLPTVSALGYAGDTPIHDANQPISSHALAGGINVSIPLYTGGRLSAQEKEASYKAAVAEQDLSTLHNQLLRDICIAFGNTQTAYENISVAKELAQNATEALELTQERYHIGKSSIVDLSQAQLAKTQAEIESANAAYGYLMERAVLDYKTGTNIPANASRHKTAYETY